MLWEESKRARSPTEMRPESGVRRPAIESSSVVFPAPEAPNRMVKPGSAWNVTSSVKSCASVVCRRESCTLRGAPAGFTLSAGGACIAVSVAANERLSFIVVHCRRRVRVGKADRDAGRITGGDSSLRLKKRLRSEGHRVRGWRIVSPTSRKSGETWGTPCFPTRPPSRFPQEGRCFAVHPIDDGQQHEAQQQQHQRRLVCPRVV